MTQEQDIVERLLKAAELRPPLLASPMLEEAAQTIAALRAERDEALSAVESDRDQWKELAKEGANIAAIYLKERNEALRALERLGSSEVFTIPFMIKDNSEGKELLARIDFARDASSNREGGEE